MFFKGASSLMAAEHSQQDAVVSRRIAWAVQYLLDRGVGVYCVLRVLTFTTLSWWNEIRVESDLPVMQVAVRIAMLLSVRKASVLVAFRLAVTDMQCGYCYQMYVCKRESEWPMGVESRLRINRYA